MIRLRYTRLSELYLDLLNEVWHAPAYWPAPRGQLIRERLFVKVELDAANPGELLTKSPARNAKLQSYFQRELALYKAGALAASDWAKIAKLWGTLANPDGTINSNYGYLARQSVECGTPDYEARVTGQPGRLRTAWAWCLESFKDDPDTRQAVIHFSRPRHLWRGNKDQVCALSAQFFIRGRQLHMGWTSRSNDLVYGTPYDIQFALWLMTNMRADLRLADARLVELELGTLSYTANSLHIYERDSDTVRAMLGLTP
jgi:thymidylate synthase